MRPDCFACQGFRQGQVRSKGQKRRPFGEGDGNARRGQTDYWCSVCKVPLCNSGNCWYFYHNRN
jgi:hypothetical protein